MINRFRDTNLTKRPINKPSKIVEKLPSNDLTINTMMKVRDPLKRLREK